MHISPMHGGVTNVFNVCIADLAVGIGGFLTMNLMPGGQVLANWAGGGGVIEGGGEPQLPMFLSYVIPAVVGSYIIFIVLLVVYFRRGIMQFG